MVELRKRPPPKETAAPPPLAKRGSASGLTSKAKKLADKAKDAIAPSTDSGTAAIPETAVAETPASAVTATPTAADAGEPTKMEGVEPTGTAAAAPPPTTAPVTAPAPVEAPASASATNADGVQKIASGADVGRKINVDGFGGTVSTHDGAETSLKELLEKSTGGVVVFTYPKASTPGCTTQACLFRDSYAPITGASLAVYGLSTDSPKANTTFATKQNLPFPLLCDPNATLTSAIGMKKPGPGKSTSRGVVIIDKQGTVKLWEQAGPQKTLDAVTEYIKSQGPSQNANPITATPAATVPTTSAKTTTSTTATSAPLTSADPAPQAPTANTKQPSALDPFKKLDEYPLVRTPSQAEMEAAETAAEVNDVAQKLDSNEDVKA